MPGIKEQNETHWILITSWGSNCHKTCQNKDLCPHQEGTGDKLYVSQFLVSPNWGSYCWFSDHSAGDRSLLKVWSGARVQWGRCLPCRQLTWLEGRAGVSPKHS